jgi:hypothetical protein
MTVRSVLEESTVTPSPKIQAPPSAESGDDRPRRRVPPAVKAVGASLLVLILIGWLQPPISLSPKPGFDPVVPQEPAHPVLAAAADVMDQENAGTLVYTNDFERPLGSSFPEWSSSRITFSNRFGLPVSGSHDPQAITNVQSPNGKRRFLGEFGGPRLDPTARTRVKQTVRLVLKELAPHTLATVSFDLLILKSWDGSSPRYGPDRWSLMVKDGLTLLDTTFSNNPKLEADQSFQDYPDPHGKPQKGAAAVRTLGYTFFGDSVYHLSFTFPHSAATLALDFTGDLFEGKGTEDESWGLDNVAVRIARDPRP